MSDTYVGADGKTYSPDGAYVWENDRWVAVATPSLPVAVAPAVPALPSDRELKRKAKAEEDARKAQVKAQEEARKVAARAEAVSDRELRRFLTTPAGKSKEAYERGDKVFQYSYDVMSQEAIIVAMVGSSVKKTTADPSEILNAVCNQGWELINGSFVFVEQGQESRDKFMSSGQNVAIKGTTVGYYLFKRAEKVSE